jgi:hypothetical protein
VRWPLIGSAIVPTYTFDGGGILPVALGIVFDPNRHAIVTPPDARTFSTAGGMKFAPHATEGTPTRWLRQGPAGVAGSGELPA